MRRILLLAAMFFLVAPAGAQAYQFEIVTPIADQATVQRAISFQLNHQVARHWQIDPVSFAPGGIPITIVPDASAPGACGQGDLDGCHEWNGTTASIYVQSKDRVDETATISHEIIETEVDQTNGALLAGQSPEAADPVNILAYEGLGGVMVSDYVYPRWFLSNPRGPWDQMQATLGAGRPLRPGSYLP